MRSVVLRAVIAASASSAVSIVTNPNPRESRVWGSYMTEAFLTCKRVNTNRKNRKTGRAYPANFGEGGLEITSVHLVTEPRNMEIVSRIMAATTFEEVYSIVK